MLLSSVTEGIEDWVVVMNANVLIVYFRARKDPKPSLSSSSFLPQLTNILKKKSHKIR